ncbi:MAG: NAD/NADP octopine/nopaline dehydrogenase family protein [Acidobacteriota bacterium]
MPEDRPVFAVFGAGHGGLAMAGHLGIMGFEARLYNRTRARLDAVIARGGVELEGEEVHGFGPVRIASDEPKEVLDGADVILIVVPATAHRFMAERCAPHLRDGQTVVLNPGRTFGALAFAQALRALGCGADVTIAETQTFLYASRVTGPGQARIFRIKNSIPLATLRAHRIPQCLNLVRKAFPQFVPGDSVFKTSFNNIGAVFHPALMLLNTGWVEDPADFEFYFQGTTESVAVVLEALDAERVAVAAALGFQALTAREWLYFAYDAVGKNLHQAIHANPGYRGILAPHRMEMRYLTEDVPCSLVPMSSLAHKFGVATPVMDALIDLASTMHARDYRAEGWTVESLGIADFDLKRLRLLAIGENRS